VDHQLLLLRHGESTWNDEQRWQGRCDPPLTDRGVRTAQRRAPDLLPFGFDLVCASTLTRARRTAEILAEGLSLGPPLLDDRLVERDVGAWAGLTDREIAARWPGQPAAWRRDDDAATPAGGETSSAVTARVTACLLDLVTAHPGKRLLIVTHGGVVRALDRADGGSGEPIPNLAGRWFDPVGDSLRRGAVLASATADTGPERH